MSLKEAVMCKRSICLAFLPVVLGLVLASTAQAKLIAWWKFDEGGGTTAFDSSGNNHHAEIKGTPLWVDGPSGFGGALDFTNTVGAEAESFDPTGGTGTFSLTFWSKWDGTGDIQHFLTKSAGWGSDTMMFQVENKGHWANVAEESRERLHLAYQSQPQAVMHKIPQNEWAHTALVFDGTHATGYLNGIDEVGPQPTGIGQPVDCPVLIGVAQPGTRVFQGVLDDMRLFDHVLSEDEILSIMAGGGDLKLSAYGPDPADGGLHVSTWVNLGWRSGPKAVSHDVYIGENYDDVNDATHDSAVFQGNQIENSLIAGFPGYPVSGGLVPGTTYYWRIDEVNEADPNSPWKGDIWSFSIPPKTAYDPDPADGAEFVDLEAILSWTGGYDAKMHTVFIGDNYDEVNNATSGMLVSKASYDPGTLEPEKIYYWRIDEFDGLTTHTGEVWAFTTPGAVGNPQPANGAVDVQVNSTLNWIAADNAASHELYFGTDANAVRNATTASLEYVGPRALGAVSYDPGGLEWAGSYAWRVDEVYPTGTVKGLVWTFTTADFILVDDFEAYNDIDPPDPASNTIYSNWIDGYQIPTNGALTSEELPPYAEQKVVHSGGQSMKYVYDTNLKICESTLTLIYPKNWTEGGVTKLSLWFRGAPVNGAERIFIALNGNAVVYHDDPAASQITGWNEWIIDLQKFADHGLNLANVNTITIGFGTKGTAAAGGTGTVYFDDIRLYR